MMPNEGNESVCWQAGWGESDPVFISAKYEPSESALDVALA